MTGVVLELSENGEYPLVPLKMCHCGNMQGLQRGGEGGMQRKGSVKWFQFE